MSSQPDALETARAQLLPLVEQLCTLAHEEGGAEQAAFFEAIRSGIERAAEVDDLAGPFMELSTSAFQGFHYSPLVAALLDHVLAVAQSLSATLAASGEDLH